MKTSYPFLVVIAALLITSCQDHFNDEQEFIDQRDQIVKEQGVFQDAELFEESEFNKALPSGFHKSKTHCRIGGPFIFHVEWLNEYCVPFARYRLVYLGPDDASQIWSVDPNNGSFNYVEGTNQFSRNPIIEFDGCYLDVGVSVRCRDGSMTSGTAGLYYPCC